MPGRKLIGQHIDEYLVEGILGQGTVGLVYHVTDASGKDWALKLFAPSIGDSLLLMNRFKVESQIVSRLEHPNIVPIVDVGLWNDRPYMVMPLIEGETLAAMLQRKNRLNELMATEIGWQIADALYHAADEGVTHRDVKPSNIMITNDGQALLADFGVSLAKDNPVLTKDGNIVGTPAYLAPEQIQHSRNIDKRTDLYSLGVVLYHVVTGTLPFIGTTYEILHAHLNEDPTPPSKLVRISPEMDRIILKAMAKAPKDRFEDNRALARDLLELNKHLRETGQYNSGWRETLSRWAAKLGLSR